MNLVIVKRQATALELLPVEVFRSDALLDHGDATVDGTDELAKITTDAFVLFYRILIIRLTLGQPY